MNFFGNLILFISDFPLNEHALNKIIHTQSLLRVNDHAIQSSGRGIKGGALGRSTLPCTQTWRPNSNFEKESTLMHSIVYSWRYICRGL